MPSYLEEIIVIAACLLLNALFASYEMAFVSVPKPELRRLARKGNRSAQRLLALRERPERTLSVLQIGITIVGAAAAAVGGAGATENVVPYFVNGFGMRASTAELLALALVVLPLTYLNVVIGELVPKTLALRDPAKIVLAGAKWLFFADRILFPVVNLLEWSTRKILQLGFRRPKPSDKPPLTTIEIDTFSPLHQQYMVNMANIGKRKVRDILLPWDQVSFIRSADRADEVANLVFSSGHTRLPVIGNGDLLGILHTKEFLTLRETGEQNWLSIVRPALRVQLDDPLLSVMRLMQERRNHLAVVIGAAGGLLGIVTLEDIMEDVVGDIFDEDDDGRIRRALASRVGLRAAGRKIGRL